MSDRTSTKLSPFEQVILAALKGAGGPLTYDDFCKLEVPKPPVAKNRNNKFNVHIKEIRRKTGINIETVRGIGYRLLDHA